MKKLTDIRPGMRVSIITDIDIEKEVADVRNAVVYDMEGASIVLSQSDPPFTSRQTGQKITVTYLVRQERSLSRTGFPGKLTGIVNNYALSSQNKVQAINIVREGPLKKYDLRMHFRVKPRTQDGINLFLKGEKTALMDISIGGARLCRSGGDAVNVDEPLSVNLIIDGQIFHCEARPVKVWRSSETARPDLEYVSLLFLNMDRRCSHLLSGKILAIERGLLSSEW